MGKNARVLRNILALLVNQMGTWTITLVLTLVIPRYLGAQVYGLYAFVGSYAGFFAIGIGLGTGTYLTWRIAREPQMAARLTVNTLALQLPLCVLGCVIALLVMPLMDSHPLTLHLTAVSIITTSISVLTATCTAGLAGLQVMRTPAYIALASSALTTLAVIVAVQMHISVIGIAMCALVSQILNFVVLLTYTQRKLRLRLSIEIELWTKIILGGLPFFAWSAVLLWYGQIDVTLLKMLVGDAEVGWYAAANRIAGIPVFLPAIVVAAILPALSHERVPTSPYFRALASRSIRLVMLVGIPAACGTILLSDHLVFMLHFPASFLQMGPLMVILGLNVPFIGLDMVLGTILIAMGRQKAWTVVGIVSAIFNPLANLWAIPFTQHQYGNGAIGAAVVTLATEVLMLVGALLLRPQNVFTWSDVWYIVRCLLAASIMIPAVRALAGFGTFSLIEAILYGVVAFATAAYTLQLVTNRDILGLLSSIQSRIGVNVTRWDSQQIAQNARGLLVAAQGMGHSAWGRVGIISRPLVAVVRAAGTISQPLTFAARETMHRLGNAISRPLESRTFAAQGHATPEAMATGDRDPFAIPPWDIAQFATTPHEAQLHMRSFRNGASHHDQAVNEDEIETAPAVPATDTTEISETDKRHPRQERAPARSQM